MTRAQWRQLFIEPRVRGLDPDGAAITEAHRHVMWAKPMLRALFEGFYHDCRQADDRYFQGAGSHRVEIGSGSSMIKQVYPDLVTSDVKCLPFVDVVFSAERLPLATGSLRAIYGINVFHHLSDPRAFLREAARVLRPGGGVVLIEPYYGPLARWLFRRLHAVEGFDERAAEWSVPQGLGPSSGANQALSYIVFKRDRAQFQTEFPELELLEDRAHTHLLYFASGGVNFRQLLPTALTPLIKGMQWALGPLNPILALQHTLVLRLKQR